MTPFPSRWLLALLAATAATACSAPTSRPAAAPQAPSAVAEPNAATALRALMDEHWQWQMRENPESATYAGDARYNDRLKIATFDSLRRERSINAEFLSRLTSGIARERLPDNDQISYDVFQSQLKEQVDELGFTGASTLVLSNKHGIHLAFGELVRAMPFRTPQDYENYLSRLRQYPEAVDAQLVLMREGMKLGWVTFRSSLSKVPAQIDTLLVKDIATSPYYAPFKKMPAEWPAEQRERLAREARKQLVGQVLPSLRKLKQFVQQDYLPKSPENGSMARYPGGPDYYRFRVHSQTTTDMTADEVHALGQAEVARLRKEMEALKTASGHKGNFASFVKWLNTDPRFFFKNGEELLARYRDIAKRVDAALPGQFAELPRTPYGIRAIPEEAGPDTPENYTPGNPDGSRAGYFNANTMALKLRPSWAMEDLLLHEAVPGHHLQSSRAQELKDLPMQRRIGWYVAYGEGWALYAESLGDALGLYTDPYSRFGYKQAESWRAARLVVDTGIHSKGWTHKQAVDWMTERTGMAREEVAAEVDRYFVWPGQALGYKIGQLHIQGLRERMTKSLGSCFDVRRFHNAVIDQGGLPLEVLDRWMGRWEEGEKRRCAASSAS